MRICILTLLSIFISLSTFAKAPECPLYANKQDCLLSVDENYENLLDLIQEEYNLGEVEIVEAAIDIKHFESLACQRTCLN